jgi:DNA-binding transcriptional ArsR family regulator
MSTDGNDLVWKALSDATRRAILDLLRDGARTTGELCGQFPELSRFAVMKHLDVLAEAGLLTVSREGRHRWNRINVVPIQRIYDRWISRHVAPVVASATSLKDHVERKKRSA